MIWKPIIYVSILNNLITIVYIIAGSKETDDIVHKKKAIDSGISVISSEFTAMKNRQLKKKNINSFIQNKLSVDDKYLIIENQVLKSNISKAIKNKINRLKGAPRILQSSKILDQNPESQTLAKITLLNPK